MCCPYSIKANISSLDSVEVLNRHEINIEKSNPMMTRLTILIWEWNDAIQIALHYGMSDW